jgi:hypothetical protein
MTFEVWQGREVEALVIVAAKLDYVAPRITRPKGYGSAHPQIEYSDEDRAAWERPMDKDPMRSPLTRLEALFADTVLGWFSYLADVDEDVRRTFRAWVSCKAQGRGALKRWQAGTGKLNGSVAHARGKCISTIVARLNEMKAPKPMISDTRFDDGSADSDVLWGLAAIAREVGRSEATTLHLIEAKAIPVRRSLGKYVASRLELREEILGRRAA